MVDLQKVTELGKATTYHQQYNPQVLVAVPRTPNPVTAYGHDIWRCWEMSWLDSHGQPITAALLLSYPASSPYIVESKSLKLYLGSLNFTRFADATQLLKTIQCDVSYIVGAQVRTQILTEVIRRQPAGLCLDTNSATSISNEPDANILTTNSHHQVVETLHSNTFRSCCPVTSQPDWATIVIQYEGHAIHQPALLSYLLSYRNHAAFHESCISTIFSDIMQQCQPSQLTVTGYFTRRGGLDINPCRSSIGDVPWHHSILPRQ